MKTEKQEAQTQAKDFRKEARKAASQGKYEVALTYKQAARKLEREHGLSTKEERLAEIAAERDERLDREDSGSMSNAERQAHDNL